MNLLERLRSQCRKEEDVPRGYLYGGMIDYVVAHGRLWQTTKLTKEDREVLRTARRVARREGDCYGNAQRLVLADVTGLLHYCEGYAIGPGMRWECQHGWAIIGAKVIDITWTDDEEKPLVGERAAGYEYFGVEIGREYIEERARTRGKLWSLIDDVDARPIFPLLRPQPPWRPE